MTSRFSLKRRTEIMVVMAVEKLIGVIESCERRTGVFVEQYEPQQPAILLCVKVQNSGLRHLELLFCNSRPPMKFICAPKVALQVSC